MFFFFFRQAARNRALATREQATRAPVSGPPQQFSLPPLATSGTSAPGSIMASAVHRVHAHMKASADGAGVA